MTTILNKEKILEQAKIFADEGKFDKAIAEYEKILLADPTDLRVKLRVAELFTKRKQIADAIRIYREVADAYSNEGFYLKAVTVLKNILRLNPTLVDVNQMLAELYERMGLTGDATRQYSILATTLDSKGEGGKALEIRRKIVDLNPEAEDARIKLAEILQREGRTDEAVDQYEAIAKVYEAQGTKDAKLADMYEKILAHRDNNEMLKSLVRIYDGLGEKKKVLKWMDQAKGISQIDPELLAMQARIYASMNQIETARSKYIALAELEKNDGRNEEALKAYAEILILLPGDDEKIFRRVEELGEGAVEELKAMVQKRRSELSEIERKKEEEKSKAEEEARRKEEAEKKKKEPVAKVAPKAQSQPPPPVQVSDTQKIKDANSAFDLGNVYMKMGLADEARIELAKAQKLYEELSSGGGKAEPLARQRLNIIESLLKGKEPPRKVEAKVKVEVEKKMEIKPKVEERPEPPKEKEPEKKKKISFV